MNINIYYPALPTGKCKYKVREFILMVDLKIWYMLNFTQKNLKWFLPKKDRTNKIRFLFL